jgi:hypothetical protein
MSRQLLSTVCVLALVGWGLTPDRARAWGREGHVIVAKIAELNLKPEARKAIFKLLGPIPISHERIATFADFVRHNPDFPEYAKSAGWHFVDIPYGQGNFDPTRDCQDGACVVNKVEEFQRVLAGNGPTDKRLEALIFLVHLVGDLHQPLHCATKKDRGGNALHVRLLGETGNHLNLHSVWDSELVQAGMKRLDAVDYAVQLNNSIKEGDRTAWQAGRPVDWALASHALAEKFAYRDAHGNELPATGTPNLDRAYIDSRVPVVASQLQKGGLRLAKVLNDALAP